MKAEDFDLPEGTIFLFEGSASDPSKFLRICCGIVQNYCSGSGIRAGFFSGAQKRVVAVMGRGGSVAAFWKAFEAHAEALMGGYGEPVGRFRPAEVVANVQVPGATGGSEEQYEVLRKSLLEGDLTLEEAGGDGSELVRFFSPPPVRTRGRRAIGADIHTSGEIVLEAVEQVLTPYEEEERYKEEVVHAPKHWYQKKKVEVIDRTRTLVRTREMKRKLRTRIEIREYTPRRVYAKAEGLAFAALPPGRFLMGSQEMGNEPGSGERPHPVELTRGLEIQVAPVTQALYQVLNGRNPSEFKNPEHPVEEVSFFDACRACNRLSDLMRLEHAYEFEGNAVHWKGLDCEGWRLPTEAEWEYACRAGTEADRFGDLANIAWYRDNSGGRTQPVRSKEPNAWGIHDMLGNVYEWCWDWFAAHEGAALAKDPAGPGQGAARVARGGCWGDEPWHLRAPCRAGSTPPDEHSSRIGFRIARTI